MFKAFRVVNSSFDPHTEMIYAAKSANRAKSLAWNDAKEAGFMLEYTQFRATRAAQFDKVAAEVGIHQVNRCIGWQDADFAFGCLETRRAS